MWNISADTSPAMLSLQVIMRSGKYFSSDIPWYCNQDLFIRILDLFGVPKHRIHKIVDVIGSELRVTDADKFSVQRRIAFRHKLVAGMFHHSICVVRPNSELDEFSCRHCLYVFDVHRADRPADSEKVAEQGETEYLTHQFVFELPAGIGCYGIGERISLLLSQLCQVFQG